MEGNADIKEAVFSYPTRPTVKVHNHEEIVIRCDKLRKNDPVGKLLKNDLLQQFANKTIQAGFCLILISDGLSKEYSFMFSLQFAGAEKFQPLSKKRAICGTCWAFRLWKVNLHFSPAKILWPCLWRDHSGAARPPGTHILLAKHCETRLIRPSMYPGFEASSALCLRSRCFSIGGSLLGSDSQFMYLNITC